MVVRVLESGHGRLTCQAHYEVLSEVSKPARRNPLGGCRCVLLASDTGSHRDASRRVECMHARGVSMKSKELISRRAFLLRAAVPVAGATILGVTRHGVALAPEPRRAYKPSYF